MSWLTRTSASATAGSLAGGLSRNRASVAAARVRAIRPCASARLAAEGRRRRRATISAVVPPWPKLMIGPNVASSATRIRSSRQRTAWRCTSSGTAPRIGSPASRRAAAMTSPASCRSSASPPDARASGRTLWRSFTTAGKPEQRRCLGGILRRGDGAGRHHRDAVGAQHRQRLVLHRGEPPGAADPGEHTRAPRRGPGATVSTVPGGSSRAAARLRRSCTRCRKPRTACSGVANTAMPASARLRRCGRAGGLAHGADQQRQPSSRRGMRRVRRSPPDRPRRLAHAPPARRPRRVRRQPRLPAPPDARNRRARRGRCRLRAAVRRAAPRPPPSARRLMALVTMLSASLRTGRARARISAAASRSSRLVTHSTPARRSAASKARSAAPLGSASRAARPDRHHRPQPRRGAGGGQEGAAVPQLPDIEQDRAGAGIARQPVQHQAEADIRAAADADDVAEADAVRLRPVQHRAAQRRRLRDQPDPAGGRRQMRARGIQPDGGHGDAERARPQHTDSAAKLGSVRPSASQTNHGRECAFGRQRPQDVAAMAAWR